jgi:hypothetical protein
MLPATSTPPLKAAAAALGQLADIYKTLPADGSVKPQLHATAAAARKTSPLKASPLKVAHILTVATPGVAAVHPQAKLGGVLDAISVNPGDILGWLKDAANYVVHIVRDGATGLWNFVVELAGQAYRFVLDAASKVMGAPWKRSTRRSRPRSKTSSSSSNSCSSGRTTSAPRTSARRCCCSR